MDLCRGRVEETVGQHIKKAAYRDGIAQYQIYAGVLVRHDVHSSLQDSCNSLFNHGYYCEIIEEKKLLNSLFTIRVPEEVAEAMEEYLLGIEEAIRNG